MPLRNTHRAIQEPGFLKLAATMRHDEIYDISDPTVYKAASGLYPPSRTILATMSTATTPHINNIDHNNQVGTFIQPTPTPT